MIKTRCDAAPLRDINYKLFYFAQGSVHVLAVNTEPGSFLKSNYRLVMRSTICVSFLIGILCSICISCNHSNDDVQIIGNWRMDSIYDNYNGFSFTNTNPVPKEVYEYRKNNTVLRKGMGEQLEYKYSLSDSILSLADAAGNSGSEFIILHLDKNRMALKKNRKVLFPGKNQVRYDVRYFTRIDSVE